MTRLNRVISLLLALVLALGVLAASGWAVSEDCPFTDIDDSPFRADIERAYQVGLMFGMAKTVFDPARQMTRAMFVVTLYRAHCILNGRQEAFLRPAGWAFDDVADGLWYSEAIYWAYAQKITNGTDASHFSPHQGVTKEQAATFLYRYEKQYGQHLGSAAYLADFSDADRISAYARRPMMWLAAEDARLFSGSQILPRSILRREELAHLLVNYFDRFNQPDVIERPADITPSSVLLCICGSYAAQSAGFRGKLFLPLTEENRALYGISVQEFVQDDLPMLTLTLFGKQLTVCDSFRQVRVDGVRGSFADTPVRLDGIWYLPMEDLISVFSWAVRYDIAGSDTPQVFYDHVVRRTDVPAGVKVPVLEYHAVSDDLGDSGNNYLYISPDALRQEIAWLVSEGYTFITFEDLDRVDRIRKPVMLTFDDGYLNNYTELYPILCDFQVKATLFVVGKTIDTPNHITAEQMREMQASGLVSFQSHTYTHSDLRALSAEECRRECELSQMAITRITGHIPVVICYPYGRANDAVEKQVRKYYHFAVYVQRTPYGYITGNDSFKIYRHEVVRGTTLAQFQSDFLSWVANMK